MGAKKLKKVSFSRLLKLFLFVVVFVYLSFFLGNILRGSLSSSSNFEENQKINEIHSLKEKKGSINSGVKQNEENFHPGKFIIERSHQVYNSNFHVKIENKKIFGEVSTCPARMELFNILNDITRNKEDKRILEKFRKKIEKVPKVYKEIVDTNNYDVLVIGAGFSGAVIADLYARKLNKKVLVVEKRDHVGGNCYDFINDNGIRVQKYGPHFFHTKHRNVWEYLSGLAEWEPYRHRVLASVDKKYVPVPVNIHTVNALFEDVIQTTEEMDEWLERNKENFPNPKNGEEAALSRVGKDLYEKIFKHYTKKQWDLYPEELAPSILNRIGVRNNYYNGYFTDKYEFIPKNGYTDIFNKIFSHKNIDVKLNVDIFHGDNRKLLDGFPKIYYSGTLDSFYDNQFGKLQWRSLRFIEVDMNKFFFLPNSVVNYPQLDPLEGITRIVEYKLLPNQPGKDKPRTTLFAEFSSSDGEEYYPVFLGKGGSENSERFKKYEELAEKETRVHFVGRLANYKYLDMDKAILHSLNLFEKVENVPQPFFPKKEVAVKEKRGKITWVLCTCRGKFDWIKSVYEYYSEKYDVLVHFIVKCGDPQRIYKWFANKNYNFRVDENVNIGRDSHCILYYLQRYQYYHHDDEVIYFAQDHLHEGNTYWIKMRQEMRDIILPNVFKTLKRDRNDFTRDVRRTRWNYMGTGCIQEMSCLYINVKARTISPDQFKKTCKYLSDFAKDHKDKFTCPKNVNGLGQYAGVRHGEFITTNQMIVNVLSRFSHFVEEFNCGLVDKGKTIMQGYMGEAYISNMFIGTFSGDIEGKVGDKMDLRRVQSFSAFVLPTLRYKNEFYPEIEDEEVWENVHAFPNKIGKCMTGVSKMELRFNPKKSVLK